MPGHPAGETCLKQVRRMAVSGRSGPCTVNHCLGLQSPGNEQRQYTMEAVILQIVGSQPLVSHKMKAKLI